MKIPIECSKGSPSELRSFVLHPQTKLQELMNRYGKTFGRAILRHCKAGEIRLKQMDKINICDESIIVEGSAEFRQTSNHFCDGVEIPGAG